MAAAALGAWTCAIIASTRTPWAPDLYALVYHPIGRHQPEGTGMFLFCMPAFLTAGWALIAAQARGWFRFRRTSRIPWELSIMIVPIWTAVLFGASLYRSWHAYVYPW